MSLVDALVELGVPDSTDLEGLVAFGDELYAVHAGPRVLTARSVSPSR